MMRMPFSTVIRRSSALMDPRGIRSISSFKELLQQAKIDQEIAKQTGPYQFDKFYEFTQLNKTNGKIYAAETNLLSKKDAILVPSIPLENLETKFTADLQKLVANEKIPKVTLLLTAFRDFGFQMLDTWASEHPEESLYTQCIHLNIVEEWYMKWFTKNIKKGLMTKLKPAHRAECYLHFGENNEFRTIMNMRNTFVGYAHLIDAKGRVRWSGVGKASPEELETLKKVTNILVEEARGLEKRK